MIRAALLTFFTSSLAALNYPLTPTQNCTDNYFGHLVHDPYQWLENGEDPLVEEWDALQSAFADKQLESGANYTTLKAYFKQLYSSQSIVTQYLGSSQKILVMQNDPEQHAPIFYLMQNVSAEPRLLLDLNEWEGVHSIGYIEPSPCGRYIAFGVEKGGSELACLYLFDTEKFEFVNEPVCGDFQFSIVWRPDSIGFYYIETRQGDYKLSQKVRYHTLGTSSYQDLLMMEDKKKKDWFYTLFTDQKTLYVQRNAFDAGVEGYKKPILKPKVSFKQYRKRKPGDVEETYYLIGGKHYLLTNENAPHFKLLSYNAFFGYWSEEIPEGDDLLIDVTGCNGKIAATYMQHGHYCVRIVDLNSHVTKEISLPEAGVAFLSSSWDKSDAWLCFSSLIRPVTVYAYSEPENQLTLETETVIEGYNPNDFELHTTFVKSIDGTLIPIHLAHKKGITSGAALLTGYGGFNLSYLPAFEHANVPWLNASAIVCLSHLRGGGEYGERWHVAGMKQNKQNVFDDCISVAEWLTQKYTTPKQLAMYGKSNGGLLAGAVLTQRPDLFGAVVSIVPLLDMLRYHHFSIGSCWIAEYGSSKKKAEFAYLSNYSPYHNVKAQSYPPTLFTTSKNDSRVDPCHARKMAALMQNLNPEGAPCLCKVFPDSGHMYHSTPDRCYRNTYHTAFMMDHIGITVPTLKGIKPFHKKITQLRQERDFEEQVRKQTLLINLKKEFERTYRVLP